MLLCSAGEPVAQKRIAAAATCATRAVATRAACRWVLREIQQVRASALCCARATSGHSMGGSIRRYCHCGCGDRHCSVVCICNGSRRCGCYLLLLRYRRIEYAGPTARLPWRRR